jgi:hypothetical protein
LLFAASSFDANLLHYTIRPAYETGNLACRAICNATEPAEAGTTTRAGGLASSERGGTAALRHGFEQASQSEDLRP